VELVDGCEVVDGDGVRRLADGSQTFADRRDQPIESILCFGRLA
jgi:hypothetical protein